MHSNIHQPITNGMIVSASLLLFWNQLEELKLHRLKTFFPVLGTLAVMENKPPPPLQGGEKAAEKNARAYCHPSSKASDTATREKRSLASKLRTSSVVGSEGGQTLGCELLGASRAIDLPGIGLQPVRQKQSAEAMRRARLRLEFTDLAR